MWNRITAFTNLIHFVRLAPFQLVWLLHQFGIPTQTHTCISLCLCITSQRQNQTRWAINRSRSRNRHCYSQLSTAKALEMNTKDWNYQRCCQCLVPSSCKQTAGCSQLLPDSKALKEAMTSWACCKPHSLRGNLIFSCTWPCSWCQRGSSVNWWATKSECKKIHC